ncbi:IS110 family transposase [Patescibacteria group bacterium]|nr:IS110 family transposase [Patescibacteria group bacterium]
MAQYSICHALLGVSFVCKMNGDKKPDVIRLKTEEDKEIFFMSTVAKGDKLYMELGGSTDKIALISVMRGAKLERIPTFRVGNNDAVRDNLAEAGWTVDDERGHGEESGDKLASRKARAMSIAYLAKTQPELFTPSRDDDVAILRIQHWYRRYRSYQKVMLASYQRLVASYNDDYLLALAASEGASAIAVKGYSAEAATKAVRELLMFVPADERSALEAKLGLDKIGTKPIKRSDMSKIFRAIIDEMMKGGANAPFLREMQHAHKEVVTNLKNLSINREVFEPIPGCGPLIAARIISAIGDIRRFKGPENLRAFAGYHHFDDGSRARRMAGKVSNWNMELKQAVFLWCEQTLKMPKSPFRTKLDERRAYELYKLLRDRQDKARGVEDFILPEAFWDRNIRSVLDVTVADLAVLSAHVDILRKKAGVSVKSEEEEKDEGEAEPITKDANLARLMRGVKMSAIQKAKRWLGQYFLKMIFKNWRKSLGLSELPEREPKANGSSEAHTNARKKKVDDKLPANLERLMLREHGFAPNP